MEPLGLKDRIRNKLRQFVTPGVVEPGHHSAIVVAVASSKGGVGKTTTAVNLACAWARFCDTKVLLCDLDAQGHVSFALGGMTWDSADTISSVLLGRHRDLIEIARGYPDIANLSVTPSDKNLGETESILGAKVGKEFVLEAALRIARTHFDLIVLDCPPNLGTITLNAMVAADKLLIPCDMSVLAMEGVTDLLATVDLLDERLDRHPQVLGVLVTRYDARTTRVNSEVLDSMGAVHGELLLPIRIPLSSMLNRAHMAGKDIFDFAPSSTGAHAYHELAEDLWGRVRPAPAVAVATASRRRARHASGATDAP
jgi:chromosome partitioning protein